MEHTTCPTHRLRPWWNRWLHRAIALLFIYTAYTVPEGPTLLHTPLVIAVRESYPTLSTVVRDIVITLLSLGGAAIILNMILRATKKHHLPKKWTDRIARFDERIFFQFVTFLYFLARWVIIIFLSLLVWYTIGTWLTETFAEYLRTPRFREQPIIVGMGILGIGLFLDSFTFWRKRFTRYFCIHYKL